jgi:hypothetical protein
VEVVTAAVSDPPPIATPPTQSKTLREPGALTPLRTLGLLTLALLWASAWLVEQFFPSDLPLPARLTLRNLTLAATSAFAVALASRYPKASALGLTTNSKREGALAPGDRRPFPQLAIASICLLGLPTLLVDIARTAVSSITVTELFAPLPIAVVVLTPYLPFARNPAPDTAPLLIPAFAGLTGILLLLPFTLPDSPRRAAFQALACLAVILSAIAAIWMNRLLTAFTLPQALLTASHANAAFALAWHLTASLATSTPLIPAALTRQTLLLELALALAYNLPQLALLLWLTRALAPTRLSTLYFAVPLLTVLEGLAFLPTPITFKFLAAAALIIFATYRLTTAPTHPDEPRLILH